jgi:hypothetical protein
MAVCGKLIPVTKEDLNEKIDKIVKGIDNETSPKWEVKFQNNSIEQVHGLLTTGFLTNLVKTKFDRDFVSTRECSGEGCSKVAQQRCHGETQARPELLKRAMKKVWPDQSKPVTLRKIAMQFFEEHKGTDFTLKCATCHSKDPTEPRVKFTPGSGYTPVKMSKYTNIGVEINGVPVTYDYSVVERGKNPYAGFYLSKDEAKPLSVKTVMNLRKDKLANFIKRENRIFSPPEGTVLNPVTGRFIANKTKAGDKKKKEKSSLPALLAKSNKAKRNNKGKAKKSPSPPRQRQPGEHTSGRVLSWSRSPSE